MHPNLRLAAGDYLKQKRHLRATIERVNAKRGFTFFDAVLCIEIPIDHAIEILQVPAWFAYNRLYEATIPGEPQFNHMCKFLGVSGTEMLGTECDEQGSCSTYHTNANER